MQNHYIKLQTPLFPISSFIPFYRHPPCACVYKEKNEIVHKAEIASLNEDRREEILDPLFT